MKFEHQILAGNSEEREELGAKIDKQYSLGNDYAQEYAIEATEREKELIRIAKDVACSVLEKYEIDAPSLPGAVDPSVTLVQSGDIELMTGGEISSGLATPIKNRIVTERKDSEVQFIMTTAHEYLHLFKKPVYRSDRSLESSTEPDLHRRGLQMFSENGDMLFGNLEEALVTKLTEEDVLSELAGMEEFRREFETSEKIRSLLIDFHDLNIPEEFKENKDKIADIIRTKILHFELNDSEIERMQLIAERAREGGVEDKTAGFVKMHRFLKDLTKKDIVRTKMRAELVDQLDGLCNEISTASKDEYPSPDSVMKKLVGVHYKGTIKDIIKFSKEVRDLIGLERYKYYVDLFIEKPKNTLEERF